MYSFLSANAACKLRLTAMPNELQTRICKKDGGRLEMHGCARGIERKALAYRIALASRPIKDGGGKPRARRFTRSGFSYRAARLRYARRRANVAGTGNRFVTR